MTLCTFCANVLIYFKAFQYSATNIKGHIILKKPDDKLNFNEHINKICKSPGNQLNALIGLTSFLGLKETGFSQQFYIFKF